MSDNLCFMRVRRKGKADPAGWSRHQLQLNAKEHTSGATERSVQSRGCNLPETHLNEWNRPTKHRDDDITYKNIAYI